jgi:DNA modification methylase
MKLNHIYEGNNIDVLKTLPDESVDCVVTSPPYWGLRDYDQEDQLGLEETPEEFVDNLVKVFSEVKRVLKSTGTLWLNLGDSYAMSSMRGKNSEFKGIIDQSKQGIVGVNKKIPQGLKAKDLVGIPFRVAFALQADGWYLRQDIIWNKPNPMPESVQDRCTKAHEYIFLLSKSSKYFYDIDAIREPFNEGGLKRINQVNLKNQKGSTRGNGGMRKNGNMKAVGNIEKGKNKRSVWTITTKPYKEAHFATFPIELPTYCIKAGCPEKVCKKCGKHYIDVYEEKLGELSEVYNGKAIKDYSKAKAQNPSDTKRRILESMRKRKTLIGSKPQCNCNVGYQGGIVLDPFMGSGTTGLAAQEQGRNYVGIDLNPKYIEIAERRLQQMNLFV